MTLEPAVLLDHLLDARSAMLAAQRLSTAGAPLFKAMQSSIDGVDAALRIARAMSLASKAAA
jgi:hypothetical protein